VKTILDFRLSSAEPLLDFGLASAPPLRHFPANGELQRHCRQGIPLGDGSAAARLLKVQVISLETQSLDELENGFRSMVKGRAGGPGHSVRQK